MPCRARTIPLIESILQFSSHSSASAQSEPFFPTTFVSVQAGPSRLPIQSVSTSTSLVCRRVCGEGLGSENRKENSIGKTVEDGGKKRWSCSRGREIIHQQEAGFGKNLPSLTRCNYQSSATRTKSHPKVTPSRSPIHIYHLTHSPSIKDVHSSIDLISRDTIAIPQTQSSLSSSRSNVRTPCRHSKRFNIDYNRIRSSLCSKMGWECTMSSVNVSGRIHRNGRNSYSDRRRMALRSVVAGQRIHSDHEELMKMNHHQVLSSNAQLHIMEWAISSFQSSLTHEAKSISIPGCSQDQIHRNYHFLRCQPTRLRYHHRSNKLSPRFWR